MEKFNWKWRIMATILIVAVWMGAGYFWQYAEGGVTGQISVGQLSDSVAGYATARAGSDSTTIPTFVGWASLFLVLLVWVPGLVKLNRSKTAALAILLLGTSFLTGCFGPAEIRPIQEIKPNETAFLVPLEGDTKSQGKFMSVDYLESAKVATKRIEIPIRKRSTGRGPTEYEWIPTMKVITVDRTPVTREWTKGGDTGSNPSNQALAVESLDSINFRAGVTCTGMIEEGDAAKYLYHFAGKPLDQVMDENVRGYLQSILAREFGSRSLTEGKRAKGEIFRTAAEDAKTHFKVLGLTINNLGSSEGLLYDDQKIQDAINKAYTAEMDIQVAEQERLAQETRNKTKVEIARAEREAAQEFAKAREAAIDRMKLEIERMRAEAALEMAKKFNGQFPNIIPQGTNLLVGLDQMAPTPKPAAK